VVGSVAKTLEIPHGITSRGADRKASRRMAIAYELRGPQAGSLPAGGLREKNHQTVKNRPEFVLDLTEQGYPFRRE